MYRVNVLMVRPEVHILPIYRTLWLLLIFKHPLNSKYSLRRFVMQLLRTLQFFTTDRMNLHPCSWPDTVQTSFSTFRSLLIFHRLTPSFPDVLVKQFYLHLAGDLPHELLLWNVRLLDISVSQGIFYHLVELSLKFVAAKILLKEFEGISVPFWGIVLALIGREIDGSVDSGSDAWGHEIGMDWREVKGLASELSAID